MEIWLAELPEIYTPRYLEALSDKLLRIHITKLLVKRIQITPCPGLKCEARDSMECMWSIVRLQNLHPVQYLYFLLSTMERMGVLTDNNIF